MAIEMSRVLHNADLLLRPHRPPDERFTPGLRELIPLILLFGMAYGAVMGTFSATSLDRLPQILYAAIKVPILLLVTFAISVPSFFVINTLIGLRRDFAEAIRALIMAQAGLTIVLSSLAPFTALWYASTGDYNPSVIFNALMFALASLTAQFILRRLYLPLIQRDVRHRLMLRLWLIIYIFVGIQMAWILRPFVGSPLSETRFFREGAFSNAYLAVAKLIWSVLTE